MDDAFPITGAMVWLLAASSIGLVLLAVLAGRLLYKLLHKDGENDSEWDHLR